MRPVAILCMAPLVWAMACPSGLFAQTADHERVRITDPEQLARWGYPPDATHVYARIGHDADVRGDRDRAETRGAAGAAFWVTATGFSFHPLSHNGEYVKGPSFLVFNGAVVVTGDERVMEAQFDVPYGARLSFVDIFGFHDSASHDFVFTTIERCLPFLGSGNPTETVLATTTVSDMDGAFVRFQSINHTVDAAGCTYHARAVFGSGAPVPSVLMQLIKIRMELRL